MSSTKQIMLQWTHTQTRLTFFIILFCLWKNSTLMSPQTGSGWGNSKNMCLSSRRVWAGFDVWIFTFSWYTTNWGSAKRMSTSAQGGGGGSKIMRFVREKQTENKTRRRRRRRVSDKRSQSREQDRITSVITWVWQTGTAHHHQSPTNWVSAKHYIKIKRRRKKKSTRSNTKRDPEPERQDPILIDSHGLVLDQRNTLHTADFFNLPSSC